MTLHRSSGQSLSVTKFATKKSGGYIVIIVLLLTAVLLTLGLSLATRTTEEVYLSGQEADTTRVFNAAESGVEKAIYDLQSGTKTVNESEVTEFLSDNERDDITGAYLTVEGKRVSDFSINIAQGDVLTLKWKDNTTITWSYINCINAAALIITLYDSRDRSAHHLAYNPKQDNGTTCLYKGAVFTGATFVDGPKSQVTLTNTSFGVTPPGADSIIRIRPLYADASLAITGSSIVELIANARDTTGGDSSSSETRKVRVLRTDPAAPSIFDYAVFSSGSLTK